METIPTLHEIAEMQVRLEMLDYERDSLIDEMRAASDGRRRQFLRDQVAQVSEERLQLAQVRGIASLLSMHGGSGDPNCG